MKKVLLLVSALLIVFSGVAAVSAYEGHLVDIKAHVENALMVEKEEINIGTAFPQEEVEKTVYVGLSQSFRDQEYYSSVKYRLFWEPKLLTHGDPKILPFEDPDNPGYYIPIYPYIYTQVDGVDSEIIGTSNASIMEVVPLGIPFWSLNTSGDECDEIHFAFDPPVFDKWYNAATDAIVTDLPSGVLTDRYYYTTTENITCGDDMWFDDVPHTDLGSNFKIQVSSIFGAD